MSGGGSAPAVQDNSLAVEQQQEAFALQQQAAAAQQKITDENTFQGNLSKAVSGATSTGDNYLAENGLSTDQYGPQIAQIISDEQAKVPDLDPNPGQYFTSGLFQTGLNSYQQQQDANNNNKVQQAFAPGFEQSYLPSTAGDSDVSTILAQQEQNAQNALQQQRSRGLLNDSGEAAAEQVLNQQGTAAKSTLDNLASGVIGSDTTDLDSIVANAGKAANQWSLGNPSFDVTPYETQVQQKATSDLSDLPGAINSALGTTQLFDIPSIIAAGGTAQGPQNLTTVSTAPSGIPGLNGPGFDQNQNNKNRGLGSTGGF